MHRLFCFSLLIAISVVTDAADLTPEQILTAFFGPSGIPDKTDYYIGEMLSSFKDQPTLGQSLPSGVQIGARLLSETDVHSVYAVTLTMGGMTQDWYAYLAQDAGQWKLEAVRTLALTGVQAMLLQQLQQKPQRTTEEEWTLHNLLLVFKTDAELKSFVLSNIEQLDEIASLATTGNTDTAQMAAKRLFIRLVETTNDGRIELNIGGIVDNFVGITYVPDGIAPPPITPDEYIYVEHVTGNWYLFKTT